MSKKEYKRRRKGGISRPAGVILWCGALLTLIALVAMLHSIDASAPLTRAAAVYYGGMLEYPAAAWMITTAGAVLADIAWKQGR